MAGIVVGSVAVSVVPSAEGFAPRLAAIVDSALKPVTDRITRQISGAISQGFTDGGRTAAAQGAKSGGAFADAFKARVTAALKSLPDAKITADSSDAERKIAEIRASLEELSSKTVGVDINEGEAVAQLDRLKASLDEIGSRSPSAQVQVDTAAASAHLAEFQAELNHVDGETATAHVNADTSQAESGISGLMALIAGLGPALIPIGAVAVGGLAGIGAAAASGAAGLGVLALGFSGVSSAVGLLGKQQTQAATDSASAAKSAGSSAAAQANAAAQVVAATEALKNARANADNQAITSAEQVKNARISLADAEHSAALAAIQSAEQVRAAEYSLTQADLQEKDAEQALADARRQAARDLQTFANNAVDAKLSVQQAQLNLTTAEEQYQADLKNPKVTPEQLAQDALNVAKAKQALIEANQAAKIAEQDNTKAQKEGVDGSPGVKTAAEQLAAARHQQLVATQNLADAERQQAAQARTSAEQITKAEQGVSDAIRAQSVQQRQSAYSIQQAQAGVASAMRSVATASQSAGSAGSTAMAGINTQIARLSPAVLHFAQYVRSTLEPAFKRLQGVAAAGLLPGVERMFKNLQPLAAPFTKFVGGLAKTMGDLAAQAGKALTAPFWQHFFKFISDTAGPNLVIMAHTIGNLAKGFAGLMEAFNPVVQQMGQGFLHLSQRFADFGANAGKSAGFQKFIDYIKKEGPLVADTIGKIVGALGHIAVALAPIGPIVLKGIGLLADAIKAIPTSVLTALAVVIGTVVAGMKLWEFGAKAVTAATKAWAVIQAVINVLLDANPIGLLIIAIAALVAGVIYAYTHFQVFRDVVDSIFNFVKTHWPLILAILTGGMAVAVLEIVKHWGAIEGAFKDAWHWVQNVFVSLWNGVKAVILTPIRDAVNLVSGAWDGLKTAFRDIWDWVSHVFANLWNGLKSIFTAPIHAVSSLIQSVFGSGGVIRSIFHSVVSAITSMWNSLKTVFEAPIKFVIDTVLDNGLIAAWNWIAGKLPGVSNIKPFHPAGFAGGGYTGDGGKYQPAGIVHAGEFVFTKEQTNAIGVPALSALAGSLPGYVEGGVVVPKGPWGGHGLTGGSIGSSVFGDLAGPIKAFIDKIHTAVGSLSRIDGSAWGHLAAAIPRGVASKMISAAEDAAKKAALFIPKAILGSSNGTAARGIWFGLRQAGLTTAQTAGVMGNMAAESGLNPYIIEGGGTSMNPAAAGGGGYGLVQWTPGSKLIPYLHGSPPATGTEIAALIAQLNGVGPSPESAAGAALRAAHSAAAAASVFMSAYERPKVPNAGPRITAAEGFYNQFKSFDMGGLIPPGPSLVYNGTGAPEIVAPQQTFNEYVNGLTGGSNLGDVTVIAQFGDETIEARSVRVAHSVVDGRIKNGEGKARQGERDPLKQLSR